MNWMPQAIRDGIIVILIISGPLVLAAAAIGLIIGILQAATQIQEQTIGSALKIIGLFLLIILTGYWMFQYLNNYTARTISTAFTFVPRQGQKAVPTGAFKDEDFRTRINSESPIKPLNVIPPEKIETEEPGGGLAPGVPYVGMPQIPEPPIITKISPPKPPQPQLQFAKPDLPLMGYQEPKQIEPENKDDENLKINFLPDSPNPQKEEIRYPGWLNN